MPLQLLETARPAQGIETLDGPFWDKRKKGATSTTIALTNEAIGMNGQLKSQTQTSSGFQDAILFGMAEQADSTYAPDRG